MLLPKYIAALCVDALNIAPDVVAGYIFHPLSHCNNVILQHKTVDRCCDHGSKTLWFPPTGTFHMTLSSQTEQRLSRHGNRNYSCNRTQDNKLDVENVGSTDQPSGPNVEFSFVWRLHPRTFSQDLQLHPLPPECSGKNQAELIIKCSPAVRGGNVTWQLVLSHQRVCFVLCF